MSTIDQLAPVAARGIPASAKHIKVLGKLLTRLMAVVLIEHASGPRPIRSGEREIHTLKALRARRLVYFNRPTRPTHTHATSRGREFIAELLGRQADALVGMTSE